MILCHHHALTGLLGSDQGAQDAHLDAGPSRATASVWPSEIGRLENDFLSGRDLFLGFWPCRARRPPSISTSRRDAGLRPPRPSAWPSSRLPHGDAQTSTGTSPMRRTLLRRLLMPAPLRGPGPDRARLGGVVAARWPLWADPGFPAGLVALLGPCGGLNHGGRRRSPSSAPARRNDRGPVRLRRQASAGADRAGCHAGSGSRTCAGRRGPARPGSSLVGSVRAELGPVDLAPECLFRCDGRVCRTGLNGELYVRQVRPPHRFRFLAQPARLQRVPVAR